MWDRRLIYAPVSGMYRKGWMKDRGMEAGGSEELALVYGPEHPAVCPPARECGRECASFSLCFLSGPARRNNVIALSKIGAQFLVSFILYSCFQNLL